MPLDATTVPYNKTRWKSLPTHDPRAVANYFLNKISKSGITKDVHEKITPLSLQKLIYIANGLHLVDYNFPLVNEQPRVGKFDPYFPLVREALSFFGGNRITRKIIEGTGEEVFFADPKTPPIEAKFTPDQISLLSDVWDIFVCLDYDCTRLTYLTGGNREEFTQLKKKVGVDAELSNTFIKNKIGGKLAGHIKSDTGDYTGVCAA